VAARIAFDLVGAKDSADKNPFDVAVGSDGWAVEYGGFDLGYTLKCIDLCVLALSVVSEKQKSYYQNHLKQILPFLNWVVVENTFAPSLGSRGNSHRLLGGLTCLAKAGHLVAQEILNAFQERAVFRDHMVPATHADDKYLAFFHLTSLFLAANAEAFGPNLKSIIFEDGISAKKQPGQAGLVFSHGDGWKLCISLKRGGGYVFETETSYEVFGGLLVSQGPLVSSESDLSDLKAELQKALDAGAMTHAQGLRLPLRLTRRKENVGLVQGSWTGQLLRLCLSLPLVRSFLRRWILSQALRKKAATELGAMTLFVNDREIHRKYELKLPNDGVFEFGAWTPVDGHSTRVFGAPKVVFKPLLRHGEN
jgi:hypothetical protein